MVLDPFGLTMLTPFHLSVMVILAGFFLLRYIRRQQRH